MFVRVSDELTALIRVGFVVVAVMPTRACPLSYSSLVGFHLRERTNFVEEVVHHRRLAFS